MARGVVNKKEGVVLELTKIVSFDQIRECCIVSDRCMNSF